MDADGPSTVFVTIDASGWRAHLADPEWVCRRAVAAALERVAPGPWLARAEVGVLLGDDPTIRELNATHRGQDRATNVLSFAAIDLIPNATPSVPNASDSGLACGPILLGDIVLALETARAEAETARKPLEDHVSHLVVHGCLHLLGYDHQANGEAARMEGLERVILADLGIADPYADDGGGDAAPGIPGEPAVEAVR